MSGTVAQRSPIKARSINLDEARALYTPLYERFRPSAQHASAEAGKARYAAELAAARAKLEHP
jgi:hypothetical protein